LPRLRSDQYEPLSRAALLDRQDSLDRIDVVRQAAEAEYALCRVRDDAAAQQHRVAVIITLLFR
jgi:hypothetical protein